MNEIGRLVIVVPEDKESFAGLGRKFVAVALESRDGVMHAESVTRYPEYAYSLIGRVCDSRATETIGGGLLVGGKTVTPEGYLKAWRAAIAQAVTPEEAAATHRLAVKLIVRGNAAKQKGMPIQWTYDTKGGFDGWAAELADRINPDKDGYFEFELDLRDPGAYLTWDIVCGYRNSRDNDPRNERGMRIELLRDNGAAVERVEGAEAHEEPVQAALFA